MTARRPGLFLPFGPVDVTLVDGSVFLVCAPFPSYCCTDGRPISGHWQECFVRKSFGKQRIRIVIANARPHIDAGLTDNEPFAERGQWRDVARMLMGFGRGTLSKAGLKETAVRN